MLVCFSTSPTLLTLAVGSIPCCPDLSLSVLRHGQMKYSVSVFIDVVISNPLEHIWTFIDHH